MADFKDAINQSLDKVYDGKYDDSPTLQQQIRSKRQQMLDQKSAMRTMTPLPPELLAIIQAMQDGGMYQQPAGKVLPANPTNPLGQTDAQDEREQLELELERKGFLKGRPKSPKGGRSAKSGDA